jgi:hypothetical protein
MANDSKQTGTQPATAPAPTPMKVIRDASNAIVDALERLPREDQLRALEAATSLLGLRRKQNAPNTSNTNNNQRGGRQ